MWQILNKAFGWQYVMYRDSATNFVARVEKLPNNEVMMFGGYCRSHYNALLNRDGTFKSRNGKWEALTWKHESTELPITQKQE